MTNENIAEQAKRLATLEKRLKLLEQALMAEQKKTAEMQQAIASYEDGLGQVLKTYDKAFDKAAQSYEPIIQRALTLSERAANDKARSQPLIVDKTGKVKKVNGGKGVALFENVVEIVDDLPKVLAAIALIISLITGGTSIASLIQSNFAKSQATEAKADAGTASVNAVEAKKDAETARQNVGTAIDAASSAQVNAAEAKKDAEIAKEGAGAALETANTAQMDAATAKQEAETAVQTVDKLVEDTANLKRP